MIKKKFKRFLYHYLFPYGGVLLVKLLSATPTAGLFIILTPGIFFQDLSIIFSISLSLFRLFVKRTTKYE